ncbi:MAG TPA: GNAT family N-acetyltransferase [Thermodesulfobacteriota bacterium]|nr:GNAT family N-acetyltransferase [Thermodesulfobacteriota bacterium]
MEKGLTLEIERLAFDHPELHDFLEKNSASIFSRTEWSKVLEEGFDSKVVSYCLRKDGKITLALPGIILDFKVMKMFYSNIPYGGFVGEMEYLPAFLPLLEGSLKKDHIHSLRIAKDSKTQFPEPEGYLKEMAFTHLLRLDEITEESLWENYKKRVRRDVRKAEKSGIRVEEARDLKEVDILFDLYLETMKRNEAYNVWTRKMLYAIHHHLVKKGEAEFLLAKLGGEVIGGMILLFSPETVYYFFAASAQKYLSLCPNDLLVHHGITLTIRQGKKFFDLMTSHQEDVALMNFKEKWGADKYPFNFYGKSLNPLRTWLWEKAMWTVSTSVGIQLARWWRGR